MGSRLVPVEAPVDITAAEMYPQPRLECPTLGYIRSIASIGISVTHGVPKDMREPSDKVCRRVSPDRWPRLWARRISALIGGQDAETSS